MKVKHKAMKSRLASVVAALAASCAALAFAAPATFRAPQVAPQVVALAAPAEKSAPTAKPGLTRLGDVRPLAKAASLTRWTAVEGGLVARLAATSATAQGLRVRLDLGTMPGAMEIR